MHSSIVQYKYIFIVISLLIYAKSHKMYLRS